MKKILEFIKEKSYYLLGATVLILVLAVAIASCSKGGEPKSYDQIENIVVEAAEKYYEQKSDLLPTKEGESVRVNVGTLIEANLLSEIYDPNDKSNKCNGYVDVIKIVNTYSYMPYLNCPGNYEPEYLADKIKNSTLDEYGNGVYEMNGEYVYRGDDVKNYVIFANQVWRIIKVDKQGDIEIVLADEQNYNRAEWDTSYNPEIGRSYGKTTDYLHTSIRRSLQAYYDEVLDDFSRSRIVPKNICVGPKQFDAKENEDEECSVIKENEYVSLLRVSDYPKASLDSGCTLYSALECTNRNYFAITGSINTWLLTRVLDNSYEVYTLAGGIDYDQAYRNKKICPVVYLSKSVIVSSGDGSYDDNYIIK